MALFTIEHIHKVEGGTSAAFESDVKAALNFITQKLLNLMADLTRLQEEVAENTTVTQSAITLLTDLSAKIRENIGNDAALNDLANELDANSKNLAQAVADNTIAAGEGGGTGEGV